MNTLKPYEIEAIADLRRALDADRKYEITRLTVERDDLRYMLARQKSPYSNLESLSGKRGLNIVVDHERD